MDSHFKPPFQQYITALGQIVPIWHFSYWVEMLPTSNLFATCTGQKCLTYASPCSKVQCVLASSPGSRWIVGEGCEKSLLHTVCAGANFLSYWACMHYLLFPISIMSVYKNTKISKNVLGNLLVQRICRACCNTHHCKWLFTWSIISKLVAI